MFECFVGIYDIKFTGVWSATLKQTRRKSIINDKDFFRVWYFSHSTEDIILLLLLITHKANIHVPSMLTIQKHDFMVYDLGIS